MKQCNSLVRENLESNNKRQIAKENNYMRTSTNTHRALTDDEAMLADTHPQDGAPAAEQRAESTGNTIAMLEEDRPTISEAAPVDPQDDRPASTGCALEDFYRDRPKTADSTKPKTSHYHWTRETMSDAVSRRLNDK